MISIQNLPSNANKRKLLLLVLGPLVIIITSIFIYIYNSRYVSTDDAYVKISIIDISPQINGLISKINVTNNQAVKKDQVIFEIEEAPFLIQYNLAKSNLDNVANQIKSTKALYRAKIADIKSAESDLKYYETEYRRAKTLHKASTISKSEFDQSQKEYSSALQALNNAIENAQAQLDILNGNAGLSAEEYPIYLQAKAELDQAKFYLDNIAIKAPCDGVIANFYLKPGTFVNTGIPLFSVIDTDDVWVEANFKETQLTNIKAGQKAVITLDTYSDKDIEALVDSVTNASGSEFSILPAQNTSGNWVKVIQRIMVKLKFKDLPSLNLSSGMSVNVVIDTKS